MTKKQADALGLARMQHACGELSSLGEAYEAERDEWMERRRGALEAVEGGSPATAARGVAPRPGAATSASSAAGDSAG